jgi:hypothetical protein
MRSITRLVLRAVICNIATPIIEKAMSKALTAGIADARSGEVLAYTLVVTTSDFGKKDDKKLVELLTNRLKQLPTGTTTEKK